MLSECEETSKLKNRLKKKKEKKRERGTNHKLQIGIGRMNEEVKDRKWRKQKRGDSWDVRCEN